MHAVSKVGVGMVCTPGRKLSSTTVVILVATEVKRGLAVTEGRPVEEIGLTSDRKYSRILEKYQTEKMPKNGSLRTGCVAHCKAPA